VGMEAATRACLLMYIYVIPHDALRNGNAMRMWLQAWKKGVGRAGGRMGLYTNSITSSRTLPQP